MSSCIDYKLTKLSYLYEQSGKVFIKIITELS